MAFADRTHIAEANGRDTPPARELMAGALLAAAIAALAIRQMAPAEAVVPALVTLLFAAAAATASLALLCRQGNLRLMWFDLAGVLTFIGIVASVFVEPDQLAGLIGTSNRPE